MKKILSFLLAILTVFVAFNQNDLTPIQKKAIEYHDLGFLSYLGKDYLNAIEYFTKSIKMDSMLVGNYIDRGSAFKDNEQYSEAEKDFKTFIRLGKEQAFQGYNNLGNLYKKQEKYLEAINQFKQALILNSKCFECYYNRAQTYEKLSKNKEAINDYTSAIKLNSSYSNAYCNRGNVKYAIKDIIGAVSDYTEALKYNPEKPEEVRHNRGMCYMELKQYDKGKVDFEFFVTKVKTNADAYYNLAVCCYYLDKFTDACLNAKKSLSLGKKDSQELINVACK
jgi:tetratricopeptide (TPR) repeat protein